MENQDPIRYMLMTFSWTSIWLFVMDAYKVSNDLSLVKLDELFYEFGLHELASFVSKAKGLALVIKNKKPKKKKETDISSKPRGKSQ